jgi:hypothetical protein
MRSRPGTDGQDSRVRAFSLLRRPWAHTSMGAVDGQPTRSCVRGSPRSQGEALQRRACSCSALLALCAFSNRAEAHIWLPELHEGQWVLKLGVPVAGSFGAYNRLDSFVSGVEANCGRMDPRSFAWIGGYVDAHWSFSDEQARFSMGPMVGWGDQGSQSVSPGLSATPAAQI